MTAVDLRTADGRAYIEVPSFAPLTAHDPDFAGRLAAAVVEASDDDHVKAIVLRATGPDFAPATPTGFPSVAGTPTTWHRAFAASTAVYQATCFAKKVVVAEVRGACHGAGSALLLCADLAVASEDAAFGSPFLDVPESNFVLAALTIRLNRAKSWLLRGQTYTAADALRIGLVNRVVPTGRLRAETERMTAAVRGMPLDGVTMSKMLQQAVYDAHGVGREFDLADHYAIHRAAVGSGLAEERA
ncbi:methylglutaconyl-CoA hydratase/2-(1,2-epoxy-1,2-dihydrophenyl)acetyl-CoA isomerase [Actinacidiphila alni]|uniref:Methylglutaconyl-CoA hydratase/2-(1,2-epoxy-1,2-dihydrophenyl)acetyl-CoA isomerase n=1 Tax=Actinacidiphila alni TaxID=380248 RepID=A0A1I2JWT8_9ACTN|nr:enoyl-CoA hydratase/isomerase family protein [Actinacidiphila alni]SFF58659.1 methylglutaconyl-CoA hydratase/2-(1,2-epoxy-1,2-dihydrophenyl)acetyl-CoA isomerase [Actinacidiphila alni]